MKRIAGIASVIMVLAAYSGLARAETKSGLYCVPAFDAPSTHPYYDWGGIANSSTVDRLNLYCPTDYLAAPVSAKIYGIGGNPSQGQYCQVAAYTATQGGWWGPAKYMCATNPTNGCTTPMSSSPPQYGSLTWSYPLGTGVLAGVLSVVYACQLPNPGTRGLAFFLGYTTT